MAWDDKRREWQTHIQSVSKAIDKHSELYTSTRDKFHWEQYTMLVTYVERLKTYIKNQERTGD